MRSLLPGRVSTGVQVAAGLVTGAAAGAIAVFLGSGNLSGVLPLIAVVAVGLLLGWIAAGTAYVAAFVAVVTLLLLGEPMHLVAADILRLGLAVVGGPILILLIRRDQRSNASAEAARVELERAGVAAREREESLRAAQEAVHAAYAATEQERARLVEVADAIPEPLIVYDAAGRGRYGNTAAMRLFGRAFVERPPDAWQRLAEPRDERGVALPYAELPQVRAQATAVRARDDPAPADFRTGPAGGRRGHADPRRRLRRAAAGRGQGGG